MNVQLVNPTDDDAAGDGLEVDDVLDARFKPAGWDRSDAMIDEWGRQSFPASDPPSNW
jgi:hypothetical protein